MVNAAHPTVIHGFSPIVAEEDGEVPDWDKAETYAELVVAGQEQALRAAGASKGEGLITIAVTDDGYVPLRSHIPTRATPFRSSCPS
jgi:hypothetical protein